MPKNINRILAYILGFILALTCYSYARTASEISSKFDSGVAAYDEGNFKSAFSIWWDLRAEDLAAMRNIAIMLRKGQGTKKDPVKARRFFEYAAEAGLVNAQADLADMLIKGEGGEPDLKRALPLLQSSADGNHPIAEYELAQIYETGGDGLVAANIDLARRLYQASASRGMRAASDRLAALGSSYSTAINPIASPKYLNAEILKSTNENDIATIKRAKSKDYAIQIGAFKTQTAAQTGWKALQAKHSSLFWSYSPDVRKVDLREKGIWYRLEVGGVSRKASAVALCNMLNVHGVHCLLREGS